MRNTLILALAFITGLSCNNSAETENQVKSTDSIAPHGGDTTNKLYSNASEPNALPQFRTKTDSCVMMREGYWRQSEFVSMDQKAAIEQEFNKIKDIYDNYHVTGDSVWGFRKMVIRDLITQPLSVSFTSLKSFFPEKGVEIFGLELENHPGQVKDGFFFTIRGVSYYGLAENEVVKVFGVYSADSDAELLEATGWLSKLMNKEKLFQVDWNARKMYDYNTIKTELVE